ncbi:hypothetical protein COCNU_02G006990 [Cocos nucifera]|uniref:Uncharacterized protein n=1 Tax=Cocos nucifera TaxID=13894 RepID=A0A8K0HYQ1_COCNU|nr:hypothetical protein COCNU_02G006990 [Cocos nucifera]
MEVVVPMAAVQDFHFQSASTSPYVSPPSSPKPFGNPLDYSFYASAPASPSRAAAIYANIFGWEDESSSSKPSGDDAKEFDFAFGFDSHLQRKASTTNLAAADELFEKGRIRPLKPYPVKDDGNGATPSSSRGGGGSKPSSQEVMEEGLKDRGRTPSTLSTTYSRSGRGTRSLSPIRGAGDFHNSLTSSTTTTTPPPPLSKGGGSKRWRLRDLLLFRSASEGRVSGRGSKDPLRKYTILSLLPSLSNKRRIMKGSTPNRILQNLPVADHQKQINARCRTRRVGVHSSAVPYAPSAVNIPWITFLSTTLSLTQFGGK